MPRGGCPQTDRQSAASRRVARGAQQAGARGGRSILDIAVRVAINAIAFVAAVTLVPHVSFGADLKLVLVAIVFGVVNAYLKPIVKMLSLPLTFVVFGLVGLIINTGMVLLTAAISGSLKLGFTLAGWPAGKLDLDVIIAAVLVAIVVSIVSTLLALVKMVTPRI